MSKIGKQSIKIPAGMTVKVSDETLTFKNERGEITLPVLRGVKPVLEGDVLQFSLTVESKQGRSNWGTLAALAANAVEGLSKGFQKTLIMEGVGYRATKEGNDLVLSVGFSHPVRYSPPAGIILEVEKNTTIHVKGFDRAAVGQAAADIRAIRRPEPYKGKGIRYADEVIRRKAGKKAATAAAA